MASNFQMSREEAKELFITCYGSQYAMWHDFGEKKHSAYLSLKIPRQVEIEWLRECHEIQYALAEEEHLKDEPYDVHIRTTLWRIAESSIQYRMYDCFERYFSAVKRFKTKLDSSGKSALAYDLVRYCRWLKDKDDAAVTYINTFKTLAIDLVNEVLNEKFTISAQKNAYREDRRKLYLEDEVRKSAYEILEEIKSL